MKDSTLSILVFLTSVLIIPGESLLFPLLFPVSIKVTFTSHHKPAPRPEPVFHFHKVPVYKEVVVKGGSDSHKQSYGNGQDYSTSYGDGHIKVYAHDPHVKGHKYASGYSSESDGHYKGHSDVHFPTSHYKGTAYSGDHAPETHYKDVHVDAHVPETSFKGGIHVGAHVKGAVHLDPFGPATHYKGSIHVGSHAPKPHYKGISHYGAHVPETHYKGTAHIGAHVPETHYKGTPHIDAHAPETHYKGIPHIDAHVPETHYKGSPHVGAHVPETHYKGTEYADDEVHYKGPSYDGHHAPPVVYSKNYGYIKAIGGTGGYKVSDYVPSNGYQPPPSSELHPTYPHSGTAHKPETGYEPVAYAPGNTYADIEAAHKATIHHGHPKAYAAEEYADLGTHYKDKEHDSTYLDDTLPAYKVVVEHPHPYGTHHHAAYADRKGSVHVKKEIVVEPLTYGGYGTSIYGDSYAKVSYKPKSFKISISSFRH